MDDGRWHWLVLAGAAYMYRRARRSSQRSALSVPIRANEELLVSLAPGVRRRRGSK
jgi:hypothetical protein